MSREAKILTAVLVVVVGGMIGLFALANGNNSSSNTGNSANAHAGELASTGPWAANAGQLAARLAALNLGAEGNTLHIHQHLDVLVHGKPVAVPKNIGIDTAAGTAAPLHIHDASGIIHVESATRRTFTLGELMTVWGLKFDASHLGGYTADATNSLQVFRNGTSVTGDPRSLGLQEHDEIMVSYGTDAELPQPVPATFEFPKDL